MSPSPRRRRPATPLRGAAIGAVAVLGLAACSSSHKQPSANGPGTAPGQPAMAAKLVSSLPAAHGPVDWITWNLPQGEPTTLYPPNAADYSSGQVVSNLCDPLLKIDAEHHLTPNLATFQQIDPLTMVYTLRSDAKFWDGKPVTAQDAAFSLNQAKDPNSIVSYIFQQVSSIEATAPNQVTVKFSAHDGGFNDAMASIAGMVLEKDYTQKAGQAIGTPDGKVMCSGPFKLDTWKTGDSVTISRNDAYWDTTRRALAAKVKFTFITDATALVQALNAGEIDGSYEVFPSAIPALRKSTAGKLVFGPSQQQLLLYVATPDGPLKNTKLRQALQTIIDRDALAKAVYSGAADPAYTQASPNMWPKDQAAAYQQAYLPFAKERALDLDAAKQLVAASGYQGQDLTLAIAAGDDSGSRTAQLIQQQAKQVGITIKINAMPPLVFTQAGYDASKRQGMDLMLASNFSYSRDPLETLGFTLLPGQTYNYTNYNNDQVTKLLTQAQEATDPAVRAQDVIAAQAIYEPESMAIPLLSTYEVSFINKRLTGAITSFSYWSMPQMAFVGAP